MLKGHVFKEQVFGNQIFALFINTFLNSANGVSNDYKNGMQVTYNNSTLTIQSGAVCIQGRFLEEDTSTDIVAGTDTAYCKLVIEIDLDKQNTEEELVQATYKIVKSTSGYPALTQSNIVENNSGVYQFELARFRTSLNGITDFEDRRTFLDFNSIYAKIKSDYEAVLEELEEELANVQDGSAYVLKTQMESVKKGKVVYENEDGTASTINITENIFDYKEAEIEYRIDVDTQDTTFGSKTIPLVESGQKSNLNDDYIGSIYYYTYGTQLTITNNKIEFYGNRVLTQGTGGRFTISNTPAIKITKITLIKDF